ncbi:hypothetical protein DM02DRAFT_647758 [Periconia macrospinosa]|uniref:Uncharacterized protein n=1 Tax=Periconia macrospinosa TaxID=97972 RepID=A0A2V1EE16_9PLEO|nr:hypothetical protein DM02DRAFT_647758 [Periconia macrospinosa]
MVDGAPKDTVVAGTNSLRDILPTAEEEIWVREPLAFPSVALTRRFTTLVLDNLLAIANRSITPNLVLVGINAWGCNIVQWGLICKELVFNIHLLVLIKEPPRYLNISWYTPCDDKYTTCLYNSTAFATAINRYQQGPITDNNISAITEEEQKHMNLVVAMVAMWVKKS